MYVLTFSTFLSFLKFPPFLKFLSSFKSDRGRGFKNVWHFMSVLTFLKFLTFPKSRPFLKFPSSFKSPWACDSENVWHLVSVYIFWHSQHSWYSWHSGIPIIPEAIVLISYHAKSGGTSLKIDWVITIWIQTEWLWGALKIKKIQKVQTLAKPPLLPPSPLHGSVKPIFFSYRRSTPSPFQRSSVTTIFFI